jgi:NADH:ubiquinone oxidoreductase subunit 2 (subunit N)
MTNLLYFFIIDRNVASVKEEIFFNKYWFVYSNLISLLLLSLFVIFFGIILSNNAKHVKILNLFCAFYLLIYFFFSSLNYSIDFDNPNLSFNQNTTSFVNLFIFIATITVLIFFLSISDVFYIAENSKIEFALLTLFIYVAAVYLISSTDFISIIILLECITFSSYVLVGFERFNKFSTTAALKYLILASIPSGFFILGLALLYQNYGTFSQDYISLLTQDYLSIWNNPDENFWKNIFINTINMTCNGELGLKHLKDVLGNIDYALTNYSPSISVSLIDIECFLSTTHKHFYTADELFVLLDTYENLTMQLGFVLDKLIMSKYLWTLMVDPASINNFLAANSEEFLVFLGQSRWEYILQWFSYFGILSFRQQLGLFISFPFEINLHFNTFFMTKLHYFTLTYLAPTLLQPFVSEQQFAVDALEFHKICEGFRNYFGMLATNLLPRNIVNVYNIEFLVKFVETAYEKNLFFNSRGMPINKYIIDSGFQEHQELLNSLAANNLVNSVYYSEPFLSIYLIIVFILVNLCFKLTASPFHFWAPTVYGGAPLATLTFLSIFSKAVIVFFFAWLFIHVFEDFSYIWQPLCLLIACLSVIFSILGAFSEKVFKRFFVYSSTGHVGFLLIGIAVLNINGIKGTVDYLLIYIVSSFIIWFIIMHLTRKTVTLINLKGLALNNPFLGFIFSIVIFSLSGIPPMGGFFVKYEIFYSLLNSSFFYIAYLKIKKHLIKTKCFLILNYV